MSQIVDELVSALADETAEVTQVVDYLHGVPAQIDAAVQAALAGGATADQLKPVTDAVALIKADTQRMKDALPAPPAGP